MDCDSPRFPSVVAGLLMLALSGCAPGAKDTHGTGTQTNTGTSADGASSTNGSGTQTATASTTSTGQTTTQTSALTSTPSSSGGATTTEHWTCYEEVYCFDPPAGVACDACEDDPECDATFRATRDTAFEDAENDPGCDCYSCGGAPCSEDWGSLYPESGQCCFQYWAECQSGT